MQSNSPVFTNNNKNPIPSKVRNVSKATVASQIKFGCSNESQAHFTGLLSPVFGENILIHYAHHHCHPVDLGTAYNSDRRN